MEIDFEDSLPPIREPVPIWPVNGLVSAANHDFEHGESSIVPQSHRTSITARSIGKAGNTHNQCGQPQLLLLYSFFILIKVMSIFTLVTQSYTHNFMFILVDIYYMTSYEIADATFKKKQNNTLLNNIP